MYCKQIARILGRRKALSHRHAGKWVIGSASSTSGSRKYRLWVPPNPDGREQLPLVMMLHGCGQSAKDLAKICGMDAIADRKNLGRLSRTADRGQPPAMLELVRSKSPGARVRRTLYPGCCYRASCVVT